MSANSGYNTGFSNISDDHLYLYVTNDKLFNTDIDYANLYSRNIIDDESKQLDKVLPYKINKELSLRNLDNAIQNIDQQTKTNTIYDIINMVPEMSEIKEFIDQSGYKEYLSSNEEPAGITFFAPINGNSQKMFDYLNKRIQNYQEYKKGDIKQLLQAHTTNFSVEPSRFIGIKNKVFTKANSFVFYVDGQKDGLEIYLHNYEPYYFNDMKEEKVIKMLKYIKCDNGSLYLISDALIPTIINN
jgi:hypothetical protein